MKKKSLVTMLAALGLVGAVGTGATLAYLSSTTTVMENTFSVGNVKVMQDEAEWDDVNNVAKASRTSAGNSYTDITPGDELAKDPTATVEAGSANCYVFMQVSGADELTDNNFEFYGFDASKWEKVSDEDGDNKGIDGVYQYKNAATNDIVEKSSDNQTLPALFTSVKYSLEAEEMASETGLEKVTIKTCAVQADHMTADTALTAALKEIAE